MTQIKAALGASAHALGMEAHIAQQITGASLVATLALACTRASPNEDATRDPGLDEASAKDAAGCSNETRERGGTRFVRLCPSRDLWIATVPLACSPGEHASVRCPTATPLLFVPDLRVGARAVAVVEREVAHRVCAYAFGGRLPTRAERQRARTVRGMATLLASDTTREGTFLGEVPEWTEDGECSSPTRPSPACLGDKHPTWFRRGDAIAWNALRRCEVEEVAPWSAVDVRLGEHCPGDKCILHAPMPLGRAARASLRCTPSVSAIHPDGVADVAAIRCVVHERTLPRE